MANSEMCAEWSKCPKATQSGCKKKNCFTARAEPPESRAPSGQAELLGYKPEIPEQLFDGYTVLQEIPPPNEERLGASACVGGTRCRGETY